MDGFTAEHVMSLMYLAGIKVNTIRRLTNNYWPDSASYQQIREENPWWLVNTDMGYIHIGWRKRVISIEWSGTGMVFPFIDQAGRDIHGDKHISSDDVTKWETGIHAWSYGKAVDYLSSLKRIHRRFEFLQAHWAENPAKPEELLEFVINGKDNKWFDEVRPEVVYTIVKARNRTEALEKFHKKYPGYRPSFTMGRTDIEEFNLRTSNSRIDLPTEILE